MTPASFRVDGGRNGRLTLVLAGDWSSRTLGRTPRKLAGELRGRTIDSVDISELGRFDTAGALAIIQAQDGAFPKAGWEGRP